EGGATEFRTVLCKYAVECGFEFKYLKYDTVRITAVCSLRESKGCTWLVHARVLDANGFFYLRKWNNEHIYGVAVHTVNNCRLGSDLVFDIFAHRIRDKPLTRPTDVAFDLKKNYGLDISYRVAWLGVEKARGDMTTGLNIFSYHSKHALTDGTFLKGRFKGNLLAATSKDGNRENATNWSWFLQHLRNALGDDRTFTFISDPHVGLMEAMPIIFPNAHDAFCMQHL
ncbi:hypothetical protein HYC85_028069, partial [Camellia sinensis]